MPAPVHYLNPAAAAVRPTLTLHRLNPQGGFAPGVPDDSGSSQHAAARALGRRAEARTAAILAMSMIVLGALLGLLWAAISPPGPAAVVWNSQHQLVVDETEAYIAIDARFGIIALVTGLVAGAVAWFVKPLRSMYTAVALAVGGIGGAYLMSLVGYLVRGRVNLDRPVGTLIAHAPMRVHIRSFFFVEAVAALLVFLVFVAFAERDDLGRD